MALTPDQEKLKEAALAATPGPWRECGHDRGGCGCGMIWATESDELVAEAWKGDDMVPAPAVAPNVNAAYVAAANPAAILAILAQLEQVQGWVSVDERLPEKYEHVLAYGAKRCEWAVMRYDENGSKAWEIETPFEFALAYPPKFWQPLPPPPEAE